MGTTHTRTIASAAATRLISCAITALSACGEKPAAQGEVNAVLEGSVFVTGPVAGVVVSAYELDLTTGSQGRLVGQSEPTDERGAFHIDLGNHFGPTLLVARGVGGAYVEPASGVNVNWDASTQLRAVFAEWTSGRDLDLELKSGAKATLVISPWTEWALALAQTRIQAKRERTYAEALKSAILRFRDHLELDYWTVVPAVLSETGTGGWNNKIQAGLAVTALSALTLRMARDSQISTAGLTSLQLVAAVRDDLSDALGVLDGVGVAGALKVGACMTVCAVGPRTLRANLSEAAADFLGSSANKSGIRVTDAQALLTRISARMSDLWPAGGDATFDTSPPAISVSGIQEADILHGTLTATIRGFDAIEMGTLTVTFSRGGSPVSGFYTASPSSPDAQTRVVTLAIRTTELTDGPLLLHIEASDKTGNQAQPVDLSLFLDNSPLGSISGTVVIGGRLVGARVRAWEYVASTKGKVLGETTTDDEGIFKLDVPDTTASAFLLEVDNPPGQAAAHYIEATTGWMVTLSSDDRLESIVTGWRNGDKRPDGMITPWTTMGTALARGLYASPLYNQNSTQWPAAVEDAFKLLEDHFFTETTRISVRNDQPADLTAGGTGTFNAQARYGLLIHALGQLADEQAAMSSATAASMNTLTLTKLLSRDLGEDGRSGAPLWNGRTASGQLAHGRVSLTSYETRVNLAVAAVDFMVTNPRYKAPFTQLDVAPLLDRVSADGNPRLYPSSEPPLPYDTIKPDAVAFTATTPAEGTVVRGDVVLEAAAHDNRALASFIWTEPSAAGALTGVRLDQTKGLAGPWILGGTLHTDLLPEGPVTVKARATDQATNTTLIERTLIVDRTPPMIMLSSAVTADGKPLAAGGWSGATTVTVKGVIVEAHPASVTATVNGSGSPLTMTSDGAFSVSLPMIATGIYSVVISANDNAGNNATPLSFSFNCDTSAPTTAVVTSTFVDDTGVSALVEGDGPGVVLYSGPGQTTTLTSGSSATFRKFGSRYSAIGPSLPEWHFLASDNHSGDQALTLSARLLRQVAAGEPMLLKDWFAVGAVSGTGYNRAQAVSASLHADVAMVSGTYVLEYRATDEFGNTSPVDCAQGVGCVRWTQEILAPPLRQRVGFSGDMCQPSFPTGHSLNFGPCPQMNFTASANMTGVGVPGGKLRIGLGYIDNPNSVPVQLALAVTAPAFVRRGLRFQNVQISDPPGIATGCDPGGVRDQTSDGTACFSSRASTTEVGTADVLDRDLSAGLEVTGASLVGMRDGTPVFEIPPRQTATVWVLSAPWTFIIEGAPADYESVGPLSRITGVLGEAWLRCTAKVHTDDQYVCTDQVNLLEVSQVTRVAVRPAATASVIAARPGGAAEATFGTATGTNVTSFPYTSFSWDTQAVGFSPI